MQLSIWDMLVKLQAHIFSICCYYAYCLLLAHCRIMASQCRLYKYYFGLYSSELINLVLFSYSREKLLDFSEPILDLKRISILSFLILLDSEILYL